MSGFDAVFKRAGELAEVHRNIAANSRAEPREQAQIERRLAEAANWMKRAMESDSFREFAHGRINWSIGQLREGCEVREELEKLLDLLLGGYDRIAERADMTRQVDLPVDEGFHCLRSFEEHVQYARNRIGLFLDDPSSVWGPAMFFENCDRGEEHLVFREDLKGTYDPLVELFLDRVDRTWANLCAALEQCDDLVTDQDGISSIPYAKENEESYYRSYWELHELLVEREEGAQASPWVWVGINLLAYRHPPCFQVFDVDKNLQIQMRGIMSDLDINHRLMFAERLGMALWYIGRNRAASSVARSDMDEPLVEPKKRGEKMSEMDAKACTILLQHPDWTVTRIAKELGRSRTYLYKLPRFRLAQKATRQGGRTEYLHRQSIRDRTGKLRPRIEPDASD